MANTSLFQPLFPEEHMLGDLLDQASRLIVDSHRLLGHASASVRAALAPVLRAMNSYYTNKIEGQHTLPADIQRAIDRQFDADRDLQRRQRLAIAHMEAEAELERSILALEARELFSPDRVRAIHAALYSRLPESDHNNAEGHPQGWPSPMLVSERNRT